MTFPRIRLALAALLPAAFLLASCASAPVPLPAPEAPPASTAPAPPPPLAELPSPPAPYHLDGEPLFDIGLAVEADSLVVQPVASAPVSWRDVDGSTRNETVAEPLRVRVSGAQILVEPVGQPRAVPLAVLTTADTLWIGETRLQAGDDPALQWNGHRWRGRFKVFVGPRGRLALATRLPLERYLLGVLPGEIGALRDSLLEAGRAQAIAARSYSLFYRGRRGAEGFDLYATVEDQVYGPVDAERPLATKCVETTRGSVAMFQGQPIRANYCSTCGGITADVWEAWPTDERAYLRSVADRGKGDADYCANSPQYRWVESWSPAQFLANLAKYAPAQGVTLPAAGLGDLQDVRVESRSRSGRVWSLRVVTSTGEVRIPAYSLRQVLRRTGTNASILRSNLFKIAVRRDSAGRVSQVIASGAGSGHGVGLCQTGALAMARGGASSNEILEHYYAGTKLAKLY